jgi:hypothetical protein
VANEILAYLAEHPDAQDTADGIVQWWILEQCVNRQAPLVKEAIRELAAKRLIIGHKAADSQVHYRINRRRTAEIAALLGSKPGKIF